MSVSSRQRAVLIGGTVAFLAAAALYVIKRRRNDEQQQSQQQGSDTTCTNSPSQPATAAPLGDVRVTKGGIPIPAGTVPPEAAEVLTQLFQQATERVASLPDSAVSQPDRLLLYALYKQATVGDRNIGRPSRLNVVAHAKYVAWGKFEGMPKESAMIKYVEASHYLAEDAASGVGGEHVSTSSQGPIPVQGESDNADIVYTEEDEYRSSDEEDMATDDKKGDSIDDDDVEVRGMGLRQSTLAGVSVTGDDNDDEMAADVATLQTTPRKRALIAAAMEGNNAKLREAIESGTDIAEADETGQTALHFAADRGAADCVRMLLDNGADANSVDREGISVLQAAVIGGCIETVKLLLDAGADPDHEDVDGDSPRSCANDDGSMEMKQLFLL